MGVIVLRMYSSSFQRSKLCLFRNASSIAYRISRQFDIHYTITWLDCSLDVQVCMYCLLLVYQHELSCLQKRSSAWTVTFMDFKLHGQHSKQYWPVTLQDCVTCKNCQPHGLSPACPPVILMSCHWHGWSVGHFPWLSLGLLVRFNRLSSVEASTNIWS